MNPLRLIRTSTFQLAWWYMGIFGASALILVGYVWWATSTYLEQQTNIAVEAEITGLVEQYRQRGIRGIENLIRERLSTSSGSSTIYLFVDSDLKPLAGNLPAWPQGTLDGAGWYSFTQVDADGRAVPARGQVFILSDGRRLLVGQNQARLEATRELINNASLWAFGIGIVLALVGGMLMSYSVTRRIDAINRTSREIMAGGLQRRMPVRGVNDEFDQLAGSLNAMLDRIDQLIEGVRAVADNIAHDLRTPLTRLRGRLETLAGRRDLDDAVRAELGDCLGESDQLLATFRALLRIARLESGTHEGEWQQVDLPALLHDAWELYAAVAEERDIRVRPATGSGSVRGDADLIFQAVSNLLDNAVKYSPAGSEVSLELADRGADVAIRVADHGPGIPAAEHGKVMDRFYRVAATAALPGSGLGLSLVRAIAVHHGGRLEFGDNAPGLVAMLVLPKSPGGPETGAPAPRPGAAAAREPAAHTAAEQVVG
ncbi:MAG: HAMP domain-containing histidine kinase [Chromatiales bacterium]|nr:HAMP domain-containing histidine kinase [Chromatiales bacterium]